MKRKLRQILPEGGQRGSTSIEYAGLIVVVALILGIIAASFFNSNIRSWVCQAVNRIFGTSIVCSIGSSDSSSLKPQKCKIGEETSKSGGEISIAFVKIGESTTLTRTTFSDGSVLITATDGASGGLTAGFGGDASWKDGHAGAKIKVGPTLEISNGSTWKFKDAAEAERFSKQLDDYLAQEELKRHPCNGGPVCVPYWPPNPVEPPPVPTTTTSDTKVSIEATEKFGGGGKKKDGDQENSEGKPAPGIEGQFTAEKKWTETKDNNNTPNDPTDDKIRYVKDGNVNGGVTVKDGVRGSGKGGFESNTSTAVTKDHNGRITNVTIVSEGGRNGSGKIEGKYDKNDDSGSRGVSGSIDGKHSRTSVTTVSLDIDPKDEEQQKIVNDWLAGNPPYLGPGMAGDEIFNPNRPVNDNPFQNLVFENSRVSYVTYETDKETKKFGANIKAGLALGVDISFEDASTKVVGAQYLREPSGESRSRAEFIECR